MAARNEIDFDFEALETELYRGLAKAFTRLQLDLPDQRFYNFTIYVSPSMVYVAIAANTEDSLDAIVRKYREEYPKYAKAYFRHEFGDFGFFAYGHDMSAYDTFLEKSNKLLSKFDQETDELLNYWLEMLNDDFDSAWEYVGPLHEQVLDICERVMRRLDKDKVFELNSERDHVTLLVRHGDSEADPEMARRLNPDSVYRRFLKNHDIAQTAIEIMQSS